LDKWRLDWEKANPGVAKEIPSKIFNNYNISNPDLADLLSTSIQFNTLSNALEIVTYNAALIYITQLRILLSLCLAEYEPHVQYIKGVTLSALPTTGKPAPERRSPLLLPGETTHAWQPALETLRIIPSINVSLSGTPEHCDLIIIAPLAIAYSWLRHQAELHDLFTPVLDHIPFFRDAEMELGAYDILDGLWG
jgi:hypothetical protein